MKRPHESERVGMVAGSLLPILLLCTLFALGGPRAASGQLAGELSGLPVPVLDLDTLDKSVVADFLFQKDVDSAQLDSVEIVYGIAHGHVGDPQLLDIDILDLNGSVVIGFTAWNPLWVFEEDAFGQERKQVLPYAHGTFTFPFRPEMAVMQMTDLETGVELASVDLVPVMHAFCRQNPGDSECSNVANRPPVCDAGGPYVAECTRASTNVALDGSGSSDPDEDPLAFKWIGQFGVAHTSRPTVPFTGVGKYPIELEVSDDFGMTRSCSSEVSVVDTRPPAIECNAPATIRPQDAPIQFTATAHDQCAGVTRIEITEFECFKFTEKGKRVDKTESCEVELSGTTISVLDSGGVGDHIRWTVVAIDDHTNRNEVSCSLTVKNPK